jgi:fermentation-respiration switch protein FrsA (DUF1100 family)
MGVVAGAVLGAAVAMMAPWGSRPATTASPPADLPVERVVLRNGRTTVRGWFVRGRRGAGAVVLLHGIGASRLDLLDRARFLAAAGYSVLLADLRGHGERSSEHCTWGALESVDVREAIAYLRAALPRERIGVIGISMGGAAAVLGPGPLPVEALVLESVYPTITDAVRDRLLAWLGALGEALTRPALRWIFPRDGVSVDDLRPIDRIREQRAPVFVVSGSDDRYTTLRESRALFARAHEPKELWVVDGAAHVDLHAFAGGEYERRVGDFLARHLRGSGGGS